MCSSDVFWCGRLQLRKIRGSNILRMLWWDLIFQLYQYLSILTWFNYLKMLVEMRFWSEMRILQGIPKLESEQWPPVRQSLKELKGQIITKKKYIRSDNSWLINGSVNNGFWLMPVLCQTVCQNAVLVCKLRYLNNEF